MTILNSVIVVEKASKVKGNSSFGDTKRTELFIYFLEKANLPQAVDKYIKYWVRERLGEINPRKQ
jgi:hypothetical protein